MATFADMVTLLLAFFVMLLSFSSIQESKFHEAVSSLQGAFGVLNNPPSVIVQPEVMKPQSDSEEWEELLYELQKISSILTQEGLASDLNVQVEKEGITVQISTPFLFRPAHAELRPESLPILDRLAKVLSELDSDVRIEGHTDNIPIRSDEFPSNWELSAARAMSVLKYLLGRGIAPHHLAAVGYGEYQPVASNESEEGRRRNRRVELFIRKDDAAGLDASASADTAVQEDQSGR